MPDSLLVTKVSLAILRHIFVPRKKILRRLSEGVRDGHSLSFVFALLGLEKRSLFVSRSSRRRP